MVCVPCHLSEEGAPAEPRGQNGLRREDSLKEKHGVTETPVRTDG